MGGECWFVKGKYSILGPFSRDELRESIARGGFHPTDMVSGDGKTEWIPAHTLGLTIKAATEGTGPSPAFIERDRPMEGTSQTVIRAWYVLRTGRTAGPFQIEGLRTAIAQGELQLDDQICEVGHKAWTSVRSLPELADLMPPTLSQPPPATTGLRSFADAVGGGIELIAKSAVTFDGASPQAQEALEQSLGLTGGRKVIAGIVGGLVIVVAIFGGIVVIAEISGPHGSSHSSVLNSRLDGVAISLTSMDLLVCVSHPLHVCRLRLGTSSGDITYPATNIAPTISCPNQAVEVMMGCEDNTSRCRESRGLFSLQVTERSDLRNEHLAPGVLRMDCREGYYDGQFNGSGF